VAPPAIARSEEDSFDKSATEIGEYNVRVLIQEAVMTLTIEVDLPSDLERFRLPAAVAARLDSLLDRQDSGQELSTVEREEAEGLVDLAELLTLLRLRSERQ
jgi:hypothetical protein